MPRDSGFLQKHEGGRSSIEEIAHRVLVIVARAASTMSRAMPKVLLAVSLPCVVVSCGSKGAVAVTAAITNPDMSVGASSGLVSPLSGSFRLQLELGQLASSGADISLVQGNFSIVDAANQATLVLLKFTTTPAAPFRLEPGGKLDIAFTVSDTLGRPGQTLTKDEAAAVCAARAAVQIAGSFTDSASGSTSVASTKFAVGCP